MSRASTTNRLSLVPSIAHPTIIRLGRTRWVVERTHSWLTRFRRLAQCYERRPEHAQGFHSLAACVILARRLRACRPRAAPALALAA